MKKQELLNLIALGEGQKLEFKESFDSNDIRKEIKYTICAFANTEGGKILVGVKDNGEIKGIKIDNNVLSQAEQLGRQIDPHIKLFVKKVENVLIIEVFESDEVYSINGMYFMRYGTETQKLTTNEVRGLFEMKNKILFEEKLNNNFDFDKDFNQLAFSNFLVESKLASNLPLDYLLENIGLAKNQVMNNAGVLFFCNDVYKFFKNATVQVFLYKGTSESSILDSKEFKKDIYSNFKEVLDYLILKLNTEYVIDGTFRKEVLEIPEVALREALLNSFSHRDYNSNYNIQIHIYWNRIEIINGGGLPNQLKVEDLGKKRFPRNILICDIFQRMNLVEKAGSGIKRIRDLLKERKLKEVDIETDNFYFKIIFWRNVITSKSIPEDNVAKDVAKDVAKNKNERKDLILKKIKGGEKMTKRGFAKELNVNPKTIERDLQELKDDGLIEFIGDTRTGVWRLKNE